MMILVETLTACKLFIVSQQLWEASSVLALNLSTCFRYRGGWEGFFLAVGSTNHRLDPENGGPEGCLPGYCDRERDGLGGCHGIIGVPQRVLDTGNGDWGEEGEREVRT